MTQLHITTRIMTLDYFMRSNSPAFGKPAAGLRLHAAHAVGFKERGTA